MNPSAPATTPTPSDRAEDSHGALPAKPDLRAGLVMILTMAVATVVVHSTVGTVLITCYAIILTAALGRPRTAVVFLLFYSSCQGLRGLCLLGAALPVIPFLGITLTLIITGFPTYIIAWTVFARLPMNEVMSTLTALRIPGTALIVLTVIYRYVPTLVGEIRIIRSASRLRHLEPAWRRWSLHPIAQCEYVLVPLLMRSARIADELSAAAVCKGLDPDRRRTGMTPVRIGALDVLLVLATVTTVVIVKIAAG